MWAMALLWIVLAGLALWAVLRFTWYPRPARRYRHFFPGEVAVVTSAGEAIFPPGGRLPQAGSDADLTGYLDRYLGASPPRLRMLMRGLLFLVEHSTFFLWAPGRAGWRRFSSLDLDQRMAVIEGWARSRVFARRLVFTSLRSLLTLAFLAHPPILRALRLAPLDIPPVVSEADLLYPPVGKPRSAIRYTRADLTPPSDGTPVDPHGPLHPDYAENDCGEKDRAKKEARP